MSDTTAAGAEAPAKWWGSSLTIRGAVLSAVSAGLPVLAGIAGIDMKGDTVKQLGEHTIAIVQAVGGIAGLSMTVAGRLRAVKRLARRVVQVVV
jgi:hypothetical protein